MSYEEAKAAAAASSRRNDEQRMMMMQQQAQPVTRFNVLPLSYEEARARAAEASRQHDERAGQGMLDCQRVVNQSPLKRQESFRRLRRLERSLSNRRLEEQGNVSRGRTHFSNGQDIVHDHNHTSRVLRSFKNFSSPAQVEQNQFPLQVEIAPGVFASVRGANETWAAVEEGNVEHSECICCSMRLVCIADAEYVLCPECRVVIPMSGLFHACGVGLGMSLIEYEAIVQGRRRPLSRSHTDQGPRRW
jgi:hypothetical protein